MKEKQVLLDFTYKIPYSLEELNLDIKLAFEIFRLHHKYEYKFARAIFGSWYCIIRSCKFCLLSSLNNIKPCVSKRRIESIIAEAILMKYLNAELENFTGGVLGNDYSELIKVTKILYYIFDEKIWINLNTVPLEIWDEIRRYVKGLIYSTETFNRKLHKFVCPSKPLEIVEKVFNFLDSEKKEKGCTLIVGIGESWRDIFETNEFLERWDVKQLNLYGLKPIKNTFYENKVSPPLTYFLFWLSKIRISNPKMIISASKSFNYINEYFSFFKAGANFYSKLRFFHFFNSRGFKKFSNLCKKYKIPQTTILELDNEQFLKFKEKVLNFNLEKIEKKSTITLDKELIRKKLENYLKIMEKRQ